MKEVETRGAYDTIGWEKKCVENFGREVWRNESIWAASV